MPRHACGTDLSARERVHLAGVLSLAPQPQFALGRESPGGHPTAREAKGNSLLAEARREQLDPDVAPVAELFLGTGDRALPHFDMSNANKAKMVGVTGLVLALTVAVTALVATRLVRPLRALTQAAQQPLEQHVRVPVTTRDEDAGILAVAFDELTERRERMEAQRKAMVSDIAHELRTPLTNIRGWLEVTRDGIVDPDPELLASLHEEAVLLQRVIDDLQDLAAADAGTLALHREAVRADELLAQVAAAHRVGAAAAGIGLRTGTGTDGTSAPTGSGAAWIDADPVRMRQALGNLVSNAIRHAPDGGCRQPLRPGGGRPGRPRGGRHRQRYRRGGSAQRLRPVLAAEESTAGAPAAVGSACPSSASSWPPTAVRSRWRVNSAPVQSSP